MTGEVNIKVDGVGVNIQTRLEHVNAVDKYCLVRSLMNAIEFEPIEFVVLHKLVGGDSDESGRIRDKDVQDMQETVATELPQ